MNGKKPSENLTVPQGEAAKEFRKNHWSIDNIGKDGQFKAGEVDETQKEFLKETEFVE